MRTDPPTCLLLMQEGLGSVGWTFSTVQTLPYVPAEVWKILGVDLLLLRPSLAARRNGKVCGFCWMDVFYGTDPPCGMVGLVGVGEGLEN